MIKTQQPSYFFNDLYFAISNRTNNLIIVTHTSAFSVSGARYYGLPHSVKSSDTCAAFRDAGRMHLNIDVDQEGFDLNI